MPVCRRCGRDGMFLKVYPTGLCNVCTESDLKAGKKEVNEFGDASIKFKLHCVQDEFVVYEDKIAITPLGMFGALNKGAKGTKTIPISSITSIQIKKPGMPSGYIQFSLPGGIENRNGIHDALKDENSVVFAQPHFETMLKIKEYIEGQISFAKSGGARSSPQPSLSEELQKLASLRDAGVLSEDEFASAKKRLLG